MQDPSRLTATACARLIRSGTLKPEALLEACLARIAAREPEVRAFAWFDPDQVRRAAIHPGPLMGLPVGVKDVLDTSDMPTEYNSPIWRGWRPRADCAAVAWMRAAGGIVMGKTVTTEFAARHPGPTANPRDLRRTPGGSSSGSAAAVADFFVPLAFGTQTAGSIIRPAAFCGVVGYKPSYGMISRAGMKIMSDTLDTIGVIARSVADCALLAGSVTGRSLGDLDVKPERLPRIGFCLSPAWESAAPETRALMDHVCETLKRAGSVPENRELPPAFAELKTAHPIIMYAESARSVGWELATARDLISSELLGLLEFGLTQSEQALEAAYAAFERTRADFLAVMEGLDILVTPAAPGQAPVGLGSTGDPAFNSIWTSLRVPCVTVPTGIGPEGAPLGIQIVGRRDEDRATLAFAQWVEATLN